MSLFATKSDVGHEAINLARDIYAKLVSKTTI